MSNHNYSPYGAFELKAAYHKNLLIGNLSVFGTALIFLTIYFLAQLFQPVNQPALGPMKVIREVIKDIPPPPTIIRESTPEFEPRQPRNTETPQYSIPVAVDDSLVVEDSELFSMTDPVSINNGGGDGDYQYDPDAPIVDIESDNIIYIPEPETFIPHEKVPEIIYKEMPEFPRLCKSIGLEGVVWLHVYVGINGDVEDVRIAKSSGNQSFDNSAKKAAYKNKYSPAVQNGNPIALWIGYKVEFKLEN